METQKKIYKRRNELLQINFINQKDQKHFKQKERVIRNQKNNLEIFKDQQIKVIQMKIENRLNNKIQKLNKNNQIRNKMNTNSNKKKLIILLENIRKQNKQLEKILKELEIIQSREPLLEQESEIQEKINYVKHYPKDQKYISLFGKNINDHAKEQQEYFQLIKAKRILNKKN